jgi:hypothetical protein
VQTTPMEVVETIHPVILMEVVETTHQVIHTAVEDQEAGVLDLERFHIVMNAKREMKSSKRRFKSLVPPHSNKSNTAHNLANPRSNRQLHNLAVKILMEQDRTRINRAVLIHNQDFKDKGKCQDQPSSLVEWETECLDK